MAGMVHGVRMLVQRRSDLLLAEVTARTKHSSNAVPANLTTITTTDMVMSLGLDRTKTMDRNSIQINMDLVLLRGEVVRCPPMHEEEAR